MKTCSKCKQEKASTEFFRESRAKDGLASSCKACKTDSNRAWVQANRDKVAGYSKKYNEENPGRHMKRHIESTYNVSYEWYLEQVEKGCAICGTTENLCVDHDHSCCSGNKSCGQCVRGLLCQSHNKALGMVQDDVDQLMAMAAYVLQNSNVLELDR